MHRTAALITACIAVAACQTGPSGAPTSGRTPNRIEVVTRPDVIFYSIEDGGQGRFRSGDNEDWTFPVSHEDYVQIRTLLEPYRAAGHVCDAPTRFTTTNGYFLWQDERGELRQRADMSCNTTAYTQNSRNGNAAYRQMNDWGRARWTPPPALPAPTTMTLVWRSWGNRLVEWTIPRGGEGRYINREGETVTFPVSGEQFDRFRALFAAYEGVRFECRRVISDGAYGSVIWSQEGHTDQSLNFDAGCTSGDASDVFQRLEQAEAMLNGLRDAR